MRDHTNLFGNILSFFKKTNLRWSWIVLFLTFLSVIVILVIPATQNPLIVLRYLFGSVLLLFLPGYCLVKTVFPSEKFFSVKSIILSIGFSLALTPIVTMVLNYTPFGITQNTVMFGIVIVNTFFSTIAIVQARFLNNRNDS